MQEQGLFGTPTVPRATRLRRSRLGQRGQTAVIFALMSLVVIGIVGLSVDVGNSLLFAEQSRRAAQAGALAGAPHLPADRVGATQAALVEAARGGYANGNNAGGRNITVVVTWPPNTDDQIQVSISQNVQTTFLTLFGFRAHTVTQSAIAKFVAPISMGNGGDQLGSDAPSLGGGGPNSQYVMRINSWGFFRSYGDGFSTNPADAIDAPNLGYVAQPQPDGDVHQISFDKGTDTADPSLPKRGGYNYLVYIPAGAGVNYSVQVYNPALAYEDCPVAPGCYNEDTNKATTWNDGNTDATWWPTYQYSLFQVRNPYNFTQDTEVSNVTFADYATKSYSNINFGTNKWQYYDRSKPNKVNRLISSNNATNPAIYHSWVDVGNYTVPANPDEAALVVGPPQTTTIIGATTAQYYRLRVDALDWQGASAEVAGTNDIPYASHSYAVRVRHADSTSCAAAVPGGCTIGALNEMCIWVLSPSGGGNFSYNMPLFSATADYAGKAVDVWSFDPGQGTFVGNIQVLQPAYPADLSGPKAVSTVGGAVPLNMGPGIRGPGPPQSITPVVAGKAVWPMGNCTVGADPACNGNGSPPTYFNGEWAKAAVQIPANYNPVAPTALNWQLQYNKIGAGTVQDVVTYMVLPRAGSPVYLLP